MTRAWGLRLLWGAWGLAVAGLLTAFLPGTAPRLTSLPGVAEGGYPERVGFVRDSPALPAAPGPLVMVVFDNNFGVGAWEVLDTTGRWWRVQDGAAELVSDDGRLLVLSTFGRRSQDTTYAVRDLVAGTTTPLPHRELRATAVAAGIPRKQVHINAPVAWSPDGTQLLVPLGRNMANDRAVALVDAAGTVTPLPLDGAPVGFLPDGRVAAVRITGPEDAPSMSVSVADPSSSTADPVSLRPTTPWVRDFLTAATTPTGELLVTESVSGADDVVRWFDPATGEELRSETVPLPGTCSIGWAGDDPVFSGKPGGYGHQARAQRLTGGRLTDLVAVHHRMQSNCVTITAAALAQGPTPMALGTWDGSWTWYWRQLALAALLGLAVLALLLRARRRRRGPA